MKEKVESQGKMVPVAGMDKSVSLKRAAPAPSPVSKVEEGRKNKRFKALTIDLTDE